MVAILGYGFVGFLTGVGYFVLLYRSVVQVTGKLTARLLLPALLRFAFASGVFFCVAYYGGAVGIVTCLVGFLLARTIVQRMWIPDAQ